VFVGGESNLVVLGSGDDIVVAAGRQNVIATGQGDDLIVALGHYNVLAAGGGADVVLAKGEYTTVSLAAGDDLALTMGRGSVVTAGEGNDYVISLGQSSVVSGGAGNDVVVLGSKASAATGGEGSDILMSAGWGLYDLFDGPEGDAISLKLEDAFGSLGEWFSSVASELGTSLGDVIGGLSSFVGTHVLDGGAGADTLYAGFGMSALHGGEGADTYVWHAGDGPTLIDGIGAGDMLQVMAGRELPDCEFSADDIHAACNIDGSWTLTFLDAGFSVGSLVVNGLDDGADATLRLVSGDGDWLDLDLDAILSGAGNDAGAFTAADLGARTDQLSQLLQTSLDHADAAAGQAQPAGVHTNLFTNASDQALQDDANSANQAPAQSS